jgi:hypothetical protein
MNLNMFNAMADDAQNTYLEQAAQRILALPGIDRSYDADILMECDTEDGEDQIFFKFMSNGGHTDAVNGLACKAHLIRNNIKFDTTADRNVIMTMTDFLAAF